MSFQIAGHRRGVAVSAIRFGPVGVQHPNDTAKMRDKHMIRMKFREPQQFVLQPDQSVNGAVVAHCCQRSNMFSTDIRATHRLGERIET